jgi:hypothetical protein
MDGVSTTVVSKRMKVDKVARGKTAAEAADSL